MRVLRRLMLVTGLGAMAFFAVGDRMAVLAERALKELDRWLQSDRRRAPLVLGAIMLAYMVGWNGVSFLRHYYFHTTYDLAFFDQVVWNTAHGRIFASSLEVGNLLADHTALYLAPLSLLYRVLASPYVLLAAQSLALALCAWPLYHLARRRLESPAAALVVAACALLYPPLGFINRFDFHPEVLALPVLMAAYERIDADDLRSATLWMGLALLAKEDLGLTVAALGLFAAVVHKRYRFGLSWAAMGVSYSLLALLVVIPAFRGEASDTLARYSWLGSTPLDMLRTMVRQPGMALQRVVTAPHLLTLLQLFAPLAFLPLAGLPALLPALPAMLYNGLSAWASQGTIYYQYMFPVIPFLYASTVRAMGRLSSAGRPNIGRATGMLIAAVALATVASWTYENPITGHTLIETGTTRPESTGGTVRDAPRPASLILPNDKAVREGLGRVPAAANLLTTMHYASHLAHRRNIGRIGQLRVPLRDSAVEAIFVNLLDLRSSATCDDYRECLAEASQAGFGLVFCRDGVVLLQRDEGDRQALRDLLANWPGCSGVPAAELEGEAT